MQGSFCIFNMRSLICFWRFFLRLIQIHSSLIQGVRVFYDPPYFRTCSCVKGGAEL